MIRALKEVSEACKRAGMEVVEWDCTNLKHDYAWELLVSLYWPDGGEEVLGLIQSGSEPILPLTKFIIQDQPSVKKMSVSQLFQVSPYAARRARKTLNITHSERQNVMSIEHFTPGPKLQKMMAEK